MKIQKILAIIIILIGIGLTAYFRLSNDCSNISGQMFTVACALVVGIWIFIISVPILVVGITLLFSWRGAIIALVGFILGLIVEFSGFSIYMVGVVPYLLMGAGLLYGLVEAAIRYINKN